MNTSTKIQDPIAIVGISVEFPSGTYSSRNLDARSFFDFLLNKGQSYEKIPRDRFNIDAWKGRNPGQVLTDTGSFLKDIDMFDPVEFGVSAKEAKGMSVSTRKLLEHSFLALWDAGIPYRGRNVGCYMSAVAFDVLGVADYNEFDAIGSFAGYPYMIANKISYHLDLRGPSIPIDTACSSTATALHLAVQSIRSGDCEAAIVGGSQLNHRFVDFVQYSQASVLSPDGKCKPFDASADGFSRSEGVAVIVLKSLHQAMKDGDRIYASVLGTGSNSTGSLAPIYAPVATAQEAAMQSAYGQTGRSPTEVDYIELHATGTAVGDPTEANWVGKAFKREEDLLIGSVKGNIGHLEITSFMASLCKVCFMFQTRLVPPNVNLRVPNPKIKWDDYRLRVATEIQPFHYRSENALVSITSSGIGGANAHVVLESCLLPEPHSATASRPTLVVSGGLSMRSTASISEELSRIVTSSSAELLPTISAVYGRKSSQMNWRSFAVVKPDGIVKFSEPQHLSRKRAPLVFVLSGQGPQHFNMGRQLFTQNPIFRRSILEMDAHYEAMIGYSLIERTGLFANGRTNTFPDIWPIEITLPALAMVQMAVIDLLRDVGHVPDAVIGHSAGETAMLYACGAGSRNMALEIAIMRGRAMAEIEGHGGGMAAFSCSPDIAKEVIRDVSSSCNSMLEIACFNAAEAVTLAGPAALLDEAVEIARKRGIVAQKLRTKVPVHSRMMERCQTSYSEGVASAFSRYPGAHRPKITTFSTLTGSQWTESFTAEYFWQNARSPVFFHQALGSLQDSLPDATFVEISPHPVLSPYLSSVTRSPDSVVCPMRRVKNEDAMNQYACFLDTIGKLVMLGYQVDFLKLNGIFTIPASSPAFTYPFSKKSIPYHSESSILVQRQMEIRNGPLNYNDLRLGATTHPDLAQHIINHQPIVPAAGFLEMAFEFGAKYLWNVRFTSMLPLLADKTVPVEVKSDGAYWSVKSIPTARTHNMQPRLHADGYMSAESVRKEYFPLDISSIKRDSKFTVGSDAFYDSIAHFAHYQTLFKRTVALFVGDGAALAQIRGHDDDLASYGRRYVLNPVILDACFHLMIHPSFTGLSNSRVYYLPSSVKSVILHGITHGDAFPGPVYAYATLKSWTPEEITYDLVVTHESGHRICTLLGFAVSRHDQIVDTRPLKCHDLVYQRFDIPTLPDTLLKSYENGPVITGQGKVDVAVLDTSNLRVVREILNFVIEDVGKRVIRICEITAAGTNPLLDIPEINLFAMHQEHSTLVRYTNYPISSDSALLNIPAAESDIIVISNISSLEKGVLSALNDSLVPGGCLILPDVNSVSSITKGDSEVKTDQISYWLTLMNDAGFTSKLYRDPEGLVTFVSQKPVFVLPVALPTSTNPLMIEFTSDVGVLQPHIKRLQSSDKSDMWIYASWNGGGAIGFVRSLRREMQSLEIRLVLFQETWNNDRRIAFIQRLAQIPHLEPELRIEEDGSITVPRLAPSSTEPDRQLSTPSVNNYTPIQEDHVLVQVVNYSVASAGLCGVVGRLVDSKSRTTIDSVLVLGITDQEAPSGLLSIHKSRILSLPASENVDFDACSLVPVIIATWAMGLGCAREPSRLKGKRITLTDETATSATLRGIFTHLGAAVHTVSLTPCPDTLDVISNSDLIISGCTSSIEAQILQSALREDAALCLWADRQIGLAAHIRRDPWIIHEALTEFVTHRQSLLHRREPSSEKPVLSTLPQKEPLFQSHKAYVLVGGIGSLGLETALWMYENGARELILTSRSGKGSLQKGHNISGLRISQYLQSRPNMNFRMEACDGSSQEEMSKLLSSISSPVGGVILLSIVLDDRLFLSHTDSTFQAPFPAKVGVLDTLEAVVSIDSLDFLIALSSAATFGNAGQTNYTSANTAVDWRLAQYKNAFSILAPAISDSTLITTSDNRLNHLLSWSMTARDLCHRIEDGLVRLRNGSLWLYIPDFDWNEVNHQFGPSSLYNHLVTGDQNGSLQPGDAEETSRDALQKTVCDLLDIDSNDFSEQTPLTSYGLDSLVAGRLAFALKRFVQLTQLELLSDLTFQDIYQRANSTASEPVTDETVKSTDVTVEEMRALVKKYTVDLPQRSSSSTARSTRKDVVVLTGSTGAIGSQLLASLVSDENVEHVYAVNRKRPNKSLKERQSSSLADRGLPVDIIESQKVALLEVDFVAPCLGLEKEVYEEMQGKVTHLIHNAWRVDFNLALSAFESSIKMVRTMLDFALSSSHSPNFVFISSIGVITDTNNLPCPVPEEAVQPEVAIGMGYSESKWVAESILGEVAEKTGLSTLVVRVGQMTSGLNGAWSTKEWFPSLVQASSRMGCLPTFEEDKLVSWIPAEQVAKSLTELRHTSKEVRFTHLVHPKPVLWQSLVKILASTLSLEVVPYAAWLDKLEKACKGNRLNAAALLPFFRSIPEKTSKDKEAFGIPSLDMTQADMFSASLKDVREMGREDVEQWLRYWRAVGMLEL